MPGLKAGSAIASLIAVVASSLHSPARVTTRTEPRNSQVTGIVNFAPCVVRERNHESTSAVEFSHTLLDRTIRVLKNLTCRSFRA